MEIFCYSVIIETEHLFYVSSNNEKITVTTSNPNEQRVEKTSEFTWGVCLQNIVLFCLSIMNEFEFEIKPGKFKKQLSIILKRIRQFEKLGHIELNKNVLLMFLHEYYILLSEWFNVLEKRMIDDKIFAIRSTIGLLATFHIMKVHV